MLTKEFWGILFIVFVGWVLVAGQPSKRIDRVCAPVEWAGNFSTSLSALVVPQYQTTLNAWFDKVDYGCEYLVWRLLYQEDWNKFQAMQAQRAQVAPQPAEASGAVPATAGPAKTAPEKAGKQSHPDPAAKSPAPAAAADAASGRTQASQ
jgi:hypothetical protein